MRIALSIIIGIHGLIHLFGFLKAFGISEFNAISQPISRFFGILWLIAFIIFTSTLGLFLAHYRYWWVVGGLSVLLSQFLIISYWSDAKPGSILNLAILVSIFIAISTLKFQNNVRNEISQMFAGLDNSEKNKFTTQMISGTPEIVQNWLLNSGIIGHYLIENVYLEQNIEMLMKPGQKDWTNATARQYFTVEPPAFNWSVNLKIKPGLQLVGRDKFEDGKGKMLIKLLAVIPIANAKNSEKVDEATMQRYLAEIVWFPTAAISPYITWEAVNEHSARATMNYKGTKASGIFYFEEDGNFKKFVAMRYKDAKDAEPTQWTVTATKTEKLHGIKIPVESQVAWKFDNENWTWLKLEITDIKYNVENTGQ